MRRLSRADRERGERGASVVIFTMFFACLMGGAGLGIDAGSLAYQRSRAQGSADAAAIAIAQDCALNKAGCSNSGALSTAGYFAAQNSSGGTVSIPGGASAGSGSVRVRVEKTVPTRFFGALGVHSKNVSAQATATWSGHPVEGSPVLPVGLPYCMYAQHQPPATSPVLFRTDLLGTVHNVIVQGGSAGRVVSTLLGDLAGTTDNCTSPDGDAITMLRGPIFLSGFEGAVNGILNWNSSICNMHLDDVNVMVGAAAGAVIPSNCINKLGTQITRGKIIMLPIYVPSNNLLQLGFELEAGGCLPLLPCLESVRVPPRLGVKVVGFAPFKITGWNFSGNSQPDPNAPACSSLNLLTHPPASVGCNGFQGYFVKSMQPDPDFTYGPDGLDLGANNVRLSE